MVFVKTNSNQDKKGLKKVKTKLDKVLLGVVVGGAVGSILGLTLAPKSGKETRKIIEENSKKVWKKAAEVLNSRKKKPESPETPILPQKEKTGFWYYLNRKLIRPKNNERK